MSFATRYSRMMEQVFGEAEADIEDEPLVHEAGQRSDIARGDSLLDDGDDDRLKSELPDVADELWTQFIRMMITAKCGDVSDSNELGMFQMKPRRLADLGLVRKLARTKAPSERTVYVAIFVPPMTSDRFLKSPQIQYQTFAKSTKDYADKVASGEIEKDKDISLSGALAVLHRCGPSGLKTWKDGERFPATQKAYDRVAGIF